MLFLALKTSSQYLHLYESWPAKWMFSTCLTAALRSLLTLPQMLHLWARAPASGNLLM